MNFASDDPFNWHFWPQYESIIHNNTFSSEKALTLFSSHIKIHHNICLELFWTVFTCVLDLFIFPPDSYKKTSYCSRKQCFERFEILMIDLFLTNTQLSLHKTLNDGLKWCGLLWCFYHLLRWRNKLIYILEGLRDSLHCKKWYVDLT